MTTLGPWIAFGLSLIVLSRAFGENPLFRFSQYLFVGLALGYTLTVVVTTIFIVPSGDMLDNPDSVGTALFIVPVLIGLLLLTRLRTQQLSWLANIPLALLFGVAAAVAIAGTLLGTLLPQLQASFFSVTSFTDGRDLGAAIGKLVLVIGVVLVLLSFRFSKAATPDAADHSDTLKPTLVAKVGRMWLLLSLGAVFAATLITYQSALIDRIQFLLRQIGVIS